MFKRLWGFLDGMLSVVGFATLSLLGFRWWSGLPVLPANLLSAPSSVPVALAPEALAEAPPAPELAPAPQATALPGAPSSSAEAPPSVAQDTAQRPVNNTKWGSTGRHDWNRELSVTINSARYVASWIDLTFEDKMLSEQERSKLIEMQRQEGKMARALNSYRGYDTLLICNVTVKYLGPEQLPMAAVMPNGFQLTSVDRNVFRSQSVPPPIPFSWARTLKPLSGVLLTGGTATGDLVFGVKSDTRPQEIIYYPR